MFLGRFQSNLLNECEIYFMFYVISYKYDPSSNLFMSKFYSALSFVLISYDFSLYLNHIKPVTYCASCVVLYYEVAKYTCKEMVMYKKIRIRR